MPDGPRGGICIVIMTSVIAYEHLTNHELNTESRRDNVKGLENPVIVEFPLRGEWMAPTTPGKKIPSHGTDQLGERFAFDFVQVDWGRSKTPFCDTDWFQYFFLGVPLNKFYGWGKEVHAPCDGEIIRVEDGYKERPRAHWVTDSLVALKNACAFNPARDGIQAVAGNYIIMRCDSNAYAAFAHLQNGSIKVSAGQMVGQGDVLGRVGHSGNSTAPHLHFQLIDSSSMLSAKGIPCAFEQYELYQDGEWKTVYEGVPSDRDRIRFYR